MKLKRKIGDWVRVKNTLKANRGYDITEEMKEKRGKKAQIVQYTGDEDAYRLAFESVTMPDIGWTDTMVEDLEPKKSEREYSTEDLERSREQLAKILLGD